jgi:hypothetical protein
LAPGGSTHLHTNKTQNNTNNNRTTQITNNVEECGPCPVFASFYPGICLNNWGKSTEKPQSRHIHVKSLYCSCNHSSISLEVNLGVKLGKKTCLVSTLLDIVANEEFLTPAIGTLGSYSGIDRVCHPNLMSLVTLSRRQTYQQWGQMKVARIASLVAKALLITAAKTRSCLLSRCCWQRVLVAWVHFFNTASPSVVVTDWGVSPPAICLFAVWAFGFDMPAYS